jgi:hypothetical protein
MKMEGVLRRNHSPWSSFSQVDAREKWSETSCKCISEVVGMIYNLVLLQLNKEKEYKKEKQEILC